MKWKRLDEYYSQSDKGYRVSKALTEGVVKYDAWAPPIPFERETFLHLGVSLNPKSAAELCEHHYQKIQQEKLNAIKTIVAD